MSIQDAPRVFVQNVPVCTGTTRTCVSTSVRGAGTHGDVLNVNTEGFSVPHHTRHTAHTTITRPQHHMETETERKKTEKDKRREEKRRHFFVFLFFFFKKKKLFFVFFSGFDHRYRFPVVRNYFSIQIQIWASLEVTLTTHRHRF